MTQISELDKELDKERTELRQVIRVGSSTLIKIIAERELVRQLRNKAFWSSVVVTATMLCLTFLLTNVFSGRGAELPAVAVVDQPPGLATALQSHARIVPYSDAQAARAAVRAEQVDAALLPGGEVVVLRKLPAELGMSLEEAHRSIAYAQRLTLLGVPEQQVAAALTVAPLHVSTLDPNAARVQQRTIIAGIGVFLLFMLMLLSGVGIAQGVAEEKSSRIVEVLLAKVRAWHLLSGKIFGLGAAALAQILLITTVVLGAAIGLGVLDAPAEAIGTAFNVLLWFVPGYVLFATLYAVAGALVSRQEDVNHVIGPVNMLQMLSLIGPAVAVTGAKDSPLMTIVSMIPGVSWSAMPVRMAYTNVPWWQIGTAVVLMLLAIAVLIRFGGRIYTGGLLQYGGMIKIKNALRGARH